MLWRPGWPRIGPGGASRCRHVQRAYKAAHRWRNAGSLSARMRGMGGIGAIVRTMSAVSNRVQRCSKSVIFIVCSIDSPHAIVLPFITAGLLLHRGMTLLLGFRIASESRVPHHIAAEGLV